MKKAIAILFIFILMFTSCTNQVQKQYPVTVNGTSIDGEIFAYYLDEVFDSADIVSASDRVSQATNKCIRYVAVNSTFASFNLSLSDDEKMKISEESNVLWNMFGVHYENIGVSKETFLKVRTSQAYTEKLRTAFFDKGGTDEISDDALRSALWDNYIAFSYVRTPEKNVDVYGHQIDYTDEERNKINLLYSSGVNSVSPAFGVEKVYNNISSSFPLTERSYETVVIDRTDSEFSVEFFNTVKNMSEGTASAFQYGGYIYLIYRLNILTDVSIFLDKRDDCLKILSEEPLQSKINSLCNSYKSSRDSAVCNNIYDKVAQNR